MIVPFIILILVLVVGAGAYLYGCFKTTQRIEEDQAERILAYKAMRGWGTYTDPERLAFIEGWLDQVFKPAIPAFPSSTSEATIAAYLSGWVWSRERNLIHKEPAEEPTFND